MNRTIPGSGINSAKESSGSSSLKESSSRPPTQHIEELNKQEKEKEKEEDENEDEFRLENLQSISEFDRNIQEGKDNKRRTQRRCVIYPDDRFRIWWDTFITV